MFLSVFDNASKKSKAKEAAAAKQAAKRAAAAASIGGQPRLLSDPDPAPDETRTNEQDIGEADPDNGKLREKDGEAVVDDRVDLLDWIDEMEILSDEKLKTLARDVGPVKCVLVKVHAFELFFLCPTDVIGCTQLRSFAHKVATSSTLLRPAWYHECTKYMTKEGIIGRDVTTRWNSTGDTISDGLQFKTVYNAMTANCDYGLREYEMSNEEWEILVDLLDILEVCLCCSSYAYLTQVFCK